MTPERFDPFGQADCDSEIRVMQGGYGDVYVRTPFSEQVAAPETYLIIGRRGAGKTALSQRYSFRELRPDPLFIDVDQPAIYHRILSELGKHQSTRGDFAIEHLQSIWEYVIWTTLAEFAVDQNAGTAATPRRSPSQVLNDGFKWLLDFYRADSARVANARVETLLDATGLQDAKGRVLARAAQRAIVLSIDTLERYDISDKALMYAMAALIQYAARFNADYADRGVHLKVFMSGEVFPYLKETVLPAPVKAIKSPVYLLWRRHDLLHLVCWRFHRSLVNRGLAPSGAIDWTDHRDIITRVWEASFGRSIVNVHGITEHTFDYVVRHTQMRPRQLILLCNAIAKRAIADGRFPKFSGDDIRLATSEVEADLAGEIINSFTSIYPRVHAIVDALMNVPPTFKGEELDRRAADTQAEWPAARFSPKAFRDLVAELGIVGRVAHRHDSGIVHADFEYSSRERLRLTHEDTCAVHPMFNRRFRVPVNEEACVVVPFAANADWGMVE